MLSKYIPEIKYLLGHLKQKLGGRAGGGVGSGPAEAGAQATGPELAALLPGRSLSTLPHSNMPKISSPPALERLSGALSLDCSFLEAGCTG